MTISLPLCLRHRRGRRGRASGQSPPRAPSGAGRGPALQYRAPSPDRPENGVRTGGFLGSFAVCGERQAPQIFDGFTLLGIVRIRQFAVDWQIGLDSLTVPLLAGGRKVLARGQDDTVAVRQREKLV